MSGKARSKKHFVWVHDFTRCITPQDVRKTKVLSAVGYFLFFMPLVFHGDSQNARFHINQSVLNLILSTVGVALLGLIPYVGPCFAAVQLVLCVVWAVRGFILALLGKARGIPLIGKATIFAYRLPGQNDDPDEEIPEL